jgi:hypothetical protein
MAHVIPTLRTATRPTYTPPATRRKTDASATTANTSGSTDFRSIFNTNTQPAAAATATASASVGGATVNTTSPAVVSTVSAASMYPMAPTTESLFGANPWCTDAGGTGPGCSYSYNPMYFATPATAAKVAQMLGGKVVAMNAITPFGPFQQNQPNLMVQMPDGKLINAGLVAGFYSHGYPQQMVDQMISSEVNGA